MGLIAGILAGSRAPAIIVPPAVLAGSSQDIWTPDQWFRSGEPGDYWHLANLDGIYQESTGVTPAAVGQAVGLTLGRRYGGARGSEIWADASASAVGESSKVSAGVYRIYSSAGALSGMTIASALGIGKVYEVTLTVDSVTVVGGGVQVDATIAPAFTTTGIKRFIVVATGTSATIKRVSAACDIQISAVSFKEIPGIHRIQSTAIARPVLQTDYSSLYDGTDDSDSSATGGGGTTGFIFIGAIKVVGGAGADRTLWSDVGTNTGYRVRINSSNQLELAAGNGSSYTTAVTTETLAAGSKYVVAAWHDGVNLNVRLGLGATYQTAFATASAGTAGFTMMKDNGAASSYANVQCYGSVYQSNTVRTVSQIQQAIRWASKRGGVGL